MRTREKCLLTLAVETEDLRLAEAFINSLTEAALDPGELELLVVYCSGEPPRGKKALQTEGAALLWEASRVNLWNRAAQYAQGRFLSFIKAGEESLPVPLLAKVLEALRDLDPDGLRLAPPGPGPWLDKKKCTGPAGEGPSKVDLRIRYAAQPYRLQGLFIKTGLLKARPFQESLGEYAPGPWLMQAFREPAGLYILEDPGFVQAPMERPAFPKMPAGDFFREYVWKPFLSSRGEDGTVPLYIQVSALRNIGRFLLHPEDGTFEKEILSFLPSVSEKALRKAPGILLFQRYYLLYQRSLLTGREHPDRMPGLESLPVYIDRLVIEDGCLTIEGFAVCLCFQEITDLYAEAEGNRYRPDRVDRDSHNQTLFGKPLSRAYGFCFRIPLRQKKGKVSFFVAERAGGTYGRKNLHFRFASCLADGWEESYSVQDRRILSCSGGSLVYEGYSLRAHIRRELGLLKKLWESPDAALRRAAARRLECRTAGLFCRREIWLISDKTFRGDDNGEALFLWLCRERPGGIRPVFVLEEGSPDFERLSQAGEVVPYLSPKHLRLLALSTCNIGAYAPKALRYPGQLPLPAFSDLLARPRQVFLQHGVTHNDVSGSIGKYVKGFHLVTCSSFREQEAFLRGGYHYDRGQLPVTGMARYDRLYDDAGKILTFAPTWRDGLVGDPDENDIRPLSPGFYSSGFCRNVLGFLNHPRLLGAARALGYRIQFVPHTVFLPHLEEFRLDEEILVPGREVCYRDVFARSSLLITDYSSVAFDFAYLGKPVVYFQFDREEFYSGGHYQQGYFDYQKDGFGEVEEDLESVVSLAISYMEAGCAMKDVYRKRCESFFAYRDQDNCRRIFGEIRRLTQEGS